jgi:CMP-N-acetylneuraminic acid synthetase
LRHWTALRNDGGCALKNNPIAIIPARSGSKRLPGKNVLPFFGHPMLAYSISAALNSGVFGEVIVSSDDPAICRVAEWYGAVSIMRPPSLATDAASLVDVANHVLNILQGRGIEPEAICQCMPNCPLVRGEDIVEHWRAFKDNQRRFQISVVPYRGVHPHWTLISDDEQHGRWLYGERYLVRSQDLPKTFCPTGAIWWARRKDFQEQGAFYGSPFHLAPMDANRGIDIDDEEDLRLAELLVHGLAARDGARPLEPISHSAFALENVSA